MAKTVKYVGQGTRKIKTKSGATKTVRVKAHLTRPTKRK